MLGMMSSDFTFIDLFAGIGGFHLAMSSLGGECLFASEWDKHAANIYARNFQLFPKGDITKIDERNIPAHDVLCAGFPCQAFSIAGNQKGFEDTRGTLFFDIARIAKYHQPKVLFLENVKNFLRHDEGRTFQIVAQVLDEIGYSVFYKVLNASHFGLPQNRERIYIVAFHRCLGVNYFHFPIPTNERISVSDILEDISLVEPITRDDIYIDSHRVQLIEQAMDDISLNRPLQIGKVGNGGQGERIYHVKGHGITLSAYGGGVGAKTGLFATKEGIRRLSPREAARLQGFPEDFILDENNNQAYKQFGNSVPINVLQAIAERIKIALQNARHDRCPKAWFRDCQARV